MKYQQKWALSKFQVIHPVTFGNKAAHNWRPNQKRIKKFLIAEKKRNIFHWYMKVLTADM